MHSYVISMTYVMTHKKIEIIMRKKRAATMSKKPFIVKEEKESMDSLLEPYCDNEFIPTNLIRSLLKCAFPSSMVIHVYSPTHYLVLAPIRDIMGAPMERWENNRPADLPRCEDIARFLVSSRKPVDGMLYISFNNKKKKFDIFDGLHRYTALQIIQQKSKHMDLISSDEFSGDMSWLWESHMMLNLRVNTPRGELRCLFEALNKNNPVSELYMRDSAQDKVQCIEAAVKAWKQAFPTHFVTSPNHVRPNSTETKFTNLLDKIYDKYQLTDETKDKLEKKLMHANAEIAKKPPKMTPTQQKKCTSTGCWLFMYDMEKLESMI